MCFLGEVLVEEEEEEESHHYDYLEKAEVLNRRERKGSICTEKGATSNADKI